MNSKLIIYLFIPGSIKKNGQIYAFIVHSFRKRRERMKNYIAYADDDR